MMEFHNYFVETVTTFRKKCWIILKPLFETLEEISMKTIL